MVRGHLARRGFIEECYFTFSYSPIHVESGEIGGVFTAVSETSAKVIGERRLDTLRELGNLGSRAKTAEQAAALAARVLSANLKDVPFSLVYLLRSDDVLSLEAAALPQQPWPEPPTRAAALRVSVAQGDHVGLLVLGVSLRLCLDDNYRSFLTLAAGQLGSAISAANAYEAERKRAEGLAEIDRAKTAFFSNISHEFRTPIALMLGPLEETLADPQPDAARHRERVEIAHRNALRLQKLVNTLLEFARIEAGRLTASYRRTDLSQLTEEPAGVFRSSIEKAGLRYLVRTSKLSEEAYVDREM